jgi:hypothetical protein
MFAFTCIDWQPGMQKRASRADDFAGSMLLGAGLGAGLAFLNGWTIASGALAGAGLGAMGNMLLRDFVEQSGARQRRPLMPMTAPRDGVQARPGGVGVGDRDVNRTPHAEQLEGFPQPNRGVNADTLARLPEHVYDPGAAAAGARETAGGTGPATLCAICLEDYIADEQLRTLPCIHNYHTHCIDRWLRQERKCPVCNYIIE